MMLHGYSATGALEEAYLQLEPQAMAKGFVYLHPDGTVDRAGEHFWNATDACCNFYGSMVDDDSYLMGLIAEISTKLTVDPKRVYVMGHSNGGFMAYRLACNHADKLAAIAVLAGEMVNDVSMCNPTDAVSVLHIQGTADTTIYYAGGSVAPGVPPYPGATNQRRRLGDVRHLQSDRGHERRAARPRSDAARRRDDRDRVRRLRKEDRRRALDHQRRHPHPDLYARVRARHDRLAPRPQEAVAARRRAVRRAD